jgi:hypothetical protein
MAVSTPLQVKFQVFQLFQLFQVFQMFQMFQVFISQKLEHPNEIEGWSDQAMT